ncbi:sporulation protein YqfC [Halothermothrix orenii]|uniref:Sporulation protein YqfC n=1 Tax=Halothermothrix orenii (strain H 168 / OCM 544 / DSM 9562) TaxID=373903 RepID=B8CXJ3_HALOH|nr:sporulation protein YqfC [Halothermothrix orenii]ACL70012.1 sporulation protein YqfC [Halothermothrix orenii H 168]
MEGLKKQFCDIFELSPEVVLDLPLLMMVGQQKIYLENHKGIALYQADEVKIRVKSGYLIVTGQDLVIEEIQTDHLSLSGKLTGLNYEQG